MHVICVRRLDAHSVAEGVAVVSLMPSTLSRHAVCVRRLDARGVAESNTVVSSKSHQH